MLNEYACLTWRTYWLLPVSLHIRDAQISRRRCAAPSSVPSWLPREESSKGRSPSPISKRRCERSCWLSTTTYAVMLCGHSPSSLTMSSESFSFKFENCETCRARLHCLHAYIYRALVPIFVSYICCQSIIQSSIIMLGGRSRPTVFFVFPSRTVSIIYQNLHT